MTWSQFRDVLPVITFVVGLFGNSIIEDLRERRADRRARQGERNNFDRNVLLEGQDAVTAYWGAVQDFVIAMIRADRDGKGWDKKNAPQELKDDWWWKQVRALTLRVRIADQALRGEIQTFMAVADNIIESPNADQADGAITGHDVVFGVLQEHIGDRLCALYT